MERKRARGVVYGLRFVADGRRRYVTLGAREDGWTRQRAETELENVMADVRRGIWTPPAPEPVPNVESDPIFHEFASDWFEARADGWRDKTRRDYQWKLSDHLLPFFKAHRLSQITVSEVDRYTVAKRKQVKKVERVKVVDGKRKKVVEQVKLSPASINKTVALLAQILDVAVEYPEYAITSNSARGRRRRLKADKPTPVWLDSAEQIAALLDAAGELDREARVDRQVPRRAILATLTFAGLRIGELVELRWRDVDLAARKLTVRASKTDAGARTIDLLPVLQDELASLKATVKPHSGARVFQTREGGPLVQSNVRNRTLALSVSRANERLEAAGSVPLPDGLSPHKLRHTFASLLVALGTDPGAVMDQLGHEDAAFTLRVYRHGMRRDQESKAKLAALVGAAEKAPTGTSTDSETSPEAAGNPSDPRESAQ
jgi:integrase